METPVLFILFNRPDTTAAVFDAIRKAKPKKLYIAADGPRKGNIDDIVSCMQTRSVVEHIDWDCKAERRFLDENAGCRMAVSSAITWFFDQEEEGIILEDDCLPHPSFFPFCETLLAQYRDNHSIMHITGNNFQFGKKYGDASYYFSTIAYIWGWASWRRAWEKYDVSLNDFPTFLRHPKRSAFFLNKASEYYWLDAIYRVYTGASKNLIIRTLNFIKQLIFPILLTNKVFMNRAFIGAHKNSTTWDFQWGYTIIKNHGICIVPQVNLVSNIGFGNKAVHAVDKDSALANMPVQILGEIKHPPKIDIAIEADMYSITAVFPRRTLSSLLTRKQIKSRISRFFGIDKRQ
ncbi:MAG: hypothetical protein CRN43_18725 [Candidatus Nephrothrix sp. EaCA]|nr:MAG: hypothetical protein CRN43_18725 [Candidatus Nephrothrix sp. EaCA]